MPDSLPTAAELQSVRVDRLVLRINGMHCAEEVAAIRKELGSRRGVHLLDVDILNAKLAATHEPHVIASEEIVASIRALGLGAEPWVDARAGPTGGNRAIDGRLVVVLKAVAPRGSCVQWRSHSVSM